MHQASIDLLNRVVADELSAVHQYMYFHFRCDDQGYDLLAGLFKKAAIEEMRHVERAAERILFLGGDVKMKLAEEVQPISDVRKMLERAAEMEEQSARDYNAWAKDSVAHADATTRALFEELVKQEEDHYDQFTTEIQHLDQFGDGYLALHSIERSRTAGK
jgi:bacterioferritin